MHKYTPMHQLYSPLLFLHLSLLYFQFFTSWPIPKDDFGWSLLTIYNVGTVQTCTAQGFFVHMSMGTLMYNCCMSLYYLLIIRYNWSNERFAKRVEPFMHVFSIGFPLVTGIFLLATNSFNPAGKRSRCFSPSCYTKKPHSLCSSLNRMGLLYIEYATSMRSHKFMC